MVAGGCLCGAIRYEIEGSVAGIWLCHCSRCRRANGSAFQAGAVAPEAGFRWLCGEDRISVYRAASGYRRAFCGACGSPVPLRVEGTQHVWLPVGGLEGAPGVRTTHHIFVGSKAPWFDIADGLPQFQGHAPRARG